MLRYRILYSLRYLNIKNVLIFINIVLSEDKIHKINRKCHVTHNQRIRIVCQPYEWIKL